MSKNNFVKFSFLWIFILFYLSLFSYIDFLFYFILERKLNFIQQNDESFLNFRNKNYKSKSNQNCNLLCEQSMSWSSWLLLSMTLTCTKNTSAESSIKWGKKNSLMHNFKDLLHWISTLFTQDYFLKQACGVLYRGNRGSMQTHSALQGVGNSNSMDKCWHIIIIINKLSPTWH